MRQIPLTLTAKMRHGVLWELRKRFRTSAALAKYLGLPQTYFGQLLNLKKTMNRKRMRHATVRRLDRKLAKFGLLWEDVFPPISQDWLDRPKDFEISQGELPEWLQLTAQNFNQQMRQLECEDRVNQALQTVRPVDRRVLEMRFGLVDGQERTLREIGDEFGVSPTCIRFKEARGLRSLRHPARSKLLRGLVIEEDPLLAYWQKEAR